MASFRGCLLEGQSEPSGMMAICDNSNWVCVWWDGLDQEMHLIFVYFVAYRLVFNQIHFKWLLSLSFRYIRTPSLHSPESLHFVQCHTWNWRFICLEWIVVVCIQIYFFSAFPLLCTMSNIHNLKEDRFLGIWSISTCSKAGASRLKGMVEETFLVHNNQEAEQGNSAKEERGGDHE